LSTAAQQRYAARGRRCGRALCGRQVRGRYPARRSCGRRDTPQCRATPSPATRLRERSPWSTPACRPRRVGWCAGPCGRRALRAERALSSGPPAPPCGRRTRP
jgi:hypothetical protein